MGGNGLHKKGKRKARKHRPQNTVMDRLEQSRADKKFKNGYRYERKEVDEVVKKLHEPLERAAESLAKANPQKPPKEKKGFLRKIFNRKAI